MTLSAVADQLRVWLDQRSAAIAPSLMALVLLVTFSLTASTGMIAQAADDVPEPPDYRLDNYRSPTPATLHGATSIDAVTLHGLMIKRPMIVIDVLPQPPRPENLPSTTYWRQPTRLDIPGSIWLANTGYGQLTPEMDSYFRKTLESLTLKDKSRALTFYCEAGCWMSWNAAKRALSYGYSHVYWFSGGMQAWDAAGYPVLSNQPLPLK